jgi:hypothetical protein
MDLRSLLLLLWCFCDSDSSTIVHQKLKNAMNVVAVVHPKQCALRFIQSLLRV